MLHKLKLAQATQPIGIGTVFSGWLILARKRVREEVELVVPENREGRTRLRHVVNDAQDFGHLGTTVYEVPHEDSLPALGVSVSHTGRPLQVTQFRQQAMQLPRMAMQVAHYVESATVHKLVKETPGNRLAAP